MTIHECVGPPRLAREMTAKMHVTKTAGVLATAIALRLIDAFFLHRNRIGHVQVDTNFLAILRQRHPIKYKGTTGTTLQEMSGMAVTGK